MSRVYIVHRWEGTPDSDWYVWLKRFLEARGFSVKILKMPHTKIPTVRSWTRYLQKNADFSKDAFFVGHSVGRQTILRSLEQIEQKVGGVLLIAPWLTLKNLDIISKIIALPWLTRDIDFAKIKHLSARRVCVFSDNDRVVPLDNRQLFAEKFGAKTLIVKNKGHFTSDDGVNDMEFMKKDLEIFFGGEK
ncbi:MAG: alpha/beta hydrolase [Candidatus Nomurabacteria bacterium]|jgi:predicted alpha/beta hydrolase family esterase|nr:alpha/beta hydrolase [Candidatus Nomurabacteria bacterium]